MIWLLPFLGPADGLMEDHFRVSHVVRSLESIYTISNVTRDGQFYGSYGYYWPSSGGEEAAYIRNGKAFKVSFDRFPKMAGNTSAVAWKAPNTVYVQQLDNGGGTYECVVDNKGRATSVKKANYNGGWTSFPNSSGSATYCPQSDLRWWPNAVGEEYLAPKQISMYKIGNGFDIGEVQIEVNMVTEYGVAIRLPDGRTVPLTGQMKQLKGFLPRRLLAVGKEGWFAIQGIGKADDPHWYVIWIEPKRR